MVPLATSPSIDPRSLPVRSTTSTTSRDVSSPRCGGVGDPSKSHRPRGVRQVMSHDRSNFHLGEATGAKEVSRTSYTNPHGARPGVMDTGD